MGIVVTGWVLSATTSLLTSNNSISEPFIRVILQLKNNMKPMSGQCLVAQGMGKAASEFIQEDLKMEYVCDYMFHLLNEYAKLLTFKPIRPRKAVELCAERMACPAGVQKKFFMESMENGPTYTSPCTMPHPYDPPSLHAFLQRKEISIKQVELWEKNFWENQNKQI
nr:uncharacterized protein LOC111998991 [Quercus suber]